jgi:hypothetical protein
MEEDQRINGNLRIKGNLIVKKIVVIIPPKDNSIIINIDDLMYNKKVDFYIDGSLIVDGELRIKDKNAVTTAGKLIEVRDITINPDEIGNNYIKGNILVGEKVTVDKDIIKVNGSIIIPQTSVTTPV